MLDVAPFEIFAWMNRESLKVLNLPPAMLDESVDFELHWITEDGSAAKMKGGAQIIPTVSSPSTIKKRFKLTSLQNSFASCPPLDIVLMGAHDVAYHLNDAEKTFIRKSFDDCTAFISICGGIFALLEAGLLGGKTVSAPRMVVKTMQQNVPDVNWVDKRWSHDGKIWSSSTLLNGTDLMRAFAEKIWGGQNGMIEALLDAGHWPARDVDFKDFHGSDFALPSFGEQF